MGLGFLAKGPMAWVVPLAAALVWGGMAKRKGEKLDLPWGFGDSDNIWGGDELVRHGVLDVS